MGTASSRQLPLGFPWETRDPFLFAVHRDDKYPVGNAQFGPAASLEGHNLGSDFHSHDEWRLYHGEQVLGFPHHPHRGFETVTVVQKGKSTTPTRWALPAALVRAIHSG